MTFIIDFPGSSHPAVSLPEGANLSQELTVLNSPLLFGCRTGICGTCLVQVEQGSDTLKAPTTEEQEALEVYAPGNAKARLACQIYLCHNISLRKIVSA